MHHGNQSQWHSRYWNIRYWARVASQQKRSLGSAIVAQEAAEPMGVTEIKLNIVNIFPFTKAHGLFLKRPASATHRIASQLFVYRNDRGALISGTSHDSYPP